MSDSASTLLARVRQALGRQVPRDPDEVRRERDEALPGYPPRPLWEDDRTRRFMERLELAAATSERIADAAEIPARVANYLPDRGGIRLRIGPHPLLTGLDWPADWEVAQGPTDVAQGPTDAAHWPAAMGVAYAGLAETGSIVMPSAPERPTSLNFLPEFHLVVLPVEDILDYMEEVWEKMAAEGRQLPRTVNVITGPSRTADVEQTIQLGAHGPRQLHVLLLG